MSTVLFAVCTEGNVNVAREHGMHRGIITKRSYWATEDEAITAMNRRWARSFGSYRPKRIWVERATAPTHLRSDLTQGRPEYTTR
jgi:hypothetical protein